MTPLSLDYHCAKCGCPILDWSIQRDRTTGKLHMTAKCHGETAEFVVYLDMRGLLFRPEGD